MRILVLLALASLVLLSAVPGPVSAESSKFIRIDIDNIVAKTAFSASAVARLNDATKNALIAVASGEIVQASFLFPLVSPANWSVKLSSENGKVLLSVDGRLTVSDDSVEYKVVSASIEKEALELKQDKEAISVVVGRVSGSLEVEVGFLVETDVVASIGLDTNGDGKLAEAEVTQQKVRGLSASVRTPVIDSIPLTALYEVKILAGDRVIASNSGSYDFAKGQNLKGNRFIDPKAVTQLSVTHKRVPYVALIPLPNSIFQLPEGKAHPEPQSEESTVDTLKAKDSPALVAQPQKGDLAGQADGSAKDIWERASLYLGQYWPLLAVLGAFLVGTSLLAKLVFGLK